MASGREDWTCRRNSEWSLSQSTPPEKAPRSPHSGSAESQRNPQCGLTLNIFLHEDILIFYCVSLNVRGSRGKTEKQSHHYIIHENTQICPRHRNGQIYSAFSFLAFAPAANSTILWQHHPLKTSMGTIRQSDFLRSSDGTQPTAVLATAFVHPSFVLWPPFAFGASPSSPSRLL